MTRLCVSVCLAGYDVGRASPPPSTLHYNAVLHAFARLGRMDDAELIFQDMRDRKVRDGLIIERHHQV